MSEIESKFEEGIQSNICLMLKEILTREDHNVSDSSSWDEEDDVKTNIYSSKEVSDDLESQSTGSHSGNRSSFRNNSYSCKSNKTINEDCQKPINNIQENISYIRFNSGLNQQNSNQIEIPLDKKYQSTDNNNNGSISYPVYFVHPQQPQINQIRTSQSYNDTYFTQLDFVLGKSKKIDKFIYSQISGSFIDVLSNTRGCKILQNYLNGTTSDIINLIFQEIKDSIITLTLSSHIHQFLLKLYDCISFPSKLMFLNIISNQFLQLSTHNISTYFIQHLIDKLNTLEEQIYIIKVINPIKLQLSLDKYGTYVIEKVISFFNYNLLDELLQFIINYFVFLACNSSGLCIIKKVIAIDQTFSDKQFHNAIKQIMINNSLVLVQNPYGNYAIQIALDIWSDANEIAYCFVNDIILLSLQKYSSNVIEKCLEKNHDIFTKFIYDLRVYNQGNEIIKMLNNTFGNFVLIKALKLCINYNEFQFLRESIVIGLSKLNNKKLNNKWMKIFLEFSY